MVVYPLKVLAVDDMQSARRVLCHLLGAIPHLTVFEAASLVEAHGVLQQEPIDIATIDLRLVEEDPDNRDGLDLVRELRQRYHAIPIVVSGFDRMDEIRAAMRSGAHDYLIRRELSAQVVVPVIEELRQRFTLERDLIALRAQASGVAPPYGLVGTSAAMQRLQACIARVATLPDRPVLIIGPTGSGKELVARAVHRLSRPPGSPLYALNCGALPEQLLESELFGHEKGAFTGAITRKLGAFAAAKDGTVLLDEVGELPLHAQPELLRVLEERVFRPVGATAECAFAGRVIAATHRDLEDSVRQGAFRADLLYRLNVLCLRVPALDERLEDIPALLACFAGRSQRELHFLPDAVALLQGRSWPGNVRQLRNVVDRMAVFADSTEISAAVVRAIIDPGPLLTAQAQTDPPRVLARAVLHSNEEFKLTAVKAALLEEAMALADGNKTAAARLLGVHRKVIERMSKHHPPGDDV